MRLRLLIAFLLAGLTGGLTGCDDKSKEQAQQVREQAQKQAESSYKDASEWVANQRFDELLAPYRESARAMLNSAGSGTNSALNSVALAPGEKAGMELQAVRFAGKHLPAVRAMVRYADARKAWQEAVKNPDLEARAKQQHAAKRQCLLACLEAGIDLTVLGTGGLIDQTARHADKVLSALKTAQGAAIFGAPAIADKLTEFLDAALQIPSVSCTMETMVSFDLEKLGDTVTGAEGSGK
jgi:hypothetical protein